MQNFTTGNLWTALTGQWWPLLLAMLVQMIHPLVDVFFLGQVSHVAVAGVGAVATLVFLVLALAQVLTVGSLVLLAQTLGTGDKARTGALFHQMMGLTFGAALLVLVLGYAGGRPLVAAFSADGEVAAAARTYLLWVMPGIAMQVLLATQASAARVCGMAAAAAKVTMGTALLNIVLTAMLVPGWFGLTSFGIAGAGLATTLSVAAGVVYFAARQSKLFERPQGGASVFVPSRTATSAVLKIGTPAGIELLMTSALVMVTFVVIAGFGADAQAGFTIGMRVLQVAFLPAAALAAAAVPIAAQNIGAGLTDRASRTFALAGLAAILFMLVLTVAAKLVPQAFVHPFTDDPETRAVAIEYLLIISWNFALAGVSMTCSSYLQSFGKTMPSLVVAIARLALFGLLLAYWATSGGLELVHVWYASVASVALQATLMAAVALRHHRSTQAPPPAPAALEPA
jgi:putative MATE family efflux protein